ncbi:MAG TPA: preprotein translocase subunit SecE [Planctomycetota bacterium]|nr:preprotein translocase subunit SecE [Planctomycetota bacterium]
MSYRKDQGRYARMLAFWGLTLVVAYGCFHASGLVNVLDGLLGTSNPTLVEQFPLLGTLKVSTVITLALLGVVAATLHRLLNRPKVADALIETEAELHKVTWPQWSETWTGTIAVAGLVLVLFVFLTGADLFLTWVVQRLF